MASALRRGLGRGAYRALRDPSAPDLVYACIKRDYRWDWSVDERAVYLARLVRDLAMPVQPLITLLDDHADDDDNTFANTLGVLDVLGRAGGSGAIDGLRQYIRVGPRWLEVIDEIAPDWPTELWDDLLPVVKGRLSTEDFLWPSEPWTTWAAVDDEIAGRVAASPASARHRPLGSEPTEDLLAMLGTAALDRQKAALRELNCRGPQPPLLTIAGTLPAAELEGPLGRAIRNLGASAVPLARAWATPPAHPMVWTAYQVLAEHGDEGDLHALLAGWDWLDSLTEDLCGYKDLATGIARIGVPAAHEAVPRLRRVWYSPHSYERAAYLRAITTLDPDSARPLLMEGLWDCESDVRRFAAEHVHLDDTTREQLRYLHADPMETPEVRAAAGDRI